MTKGKGGKKKERLNSLAPNSSELKTKYKGVQSKLFLRQMVV